MQLDFHHAENGCQTTVALQEVDAGRGDGDADQVRQPARQPVADAFDRYEPVLCQVDEIPGQIAGIDLSDLLGGQLTYGLGMTLLQEMQDTQLKRAVNVHMVGPSVNGCRVASASCHGVGRPPVQRREDRIPRGLISRDAARSTRAPATLLAWLVVHAASLFFFPRAEMATDGNA